jgi:hypothetical protein
MRFFHITFTSTPHCAATAVFMQVQAAKGASLSVPIQELVICYESTLPQIMTKQGTELDSSRNRVCKRIRKLLHCCIQHKYFSQLPPQNTERSDTEFNTIAHQLHTFISAISACTGANSEAADLQILGEGPRILVDLEQQFSLVADFEVLEERGHLEAEQISWLRAELQGQDDAGQAGDEQAIVAEVQSVFPELGHGFIQQCLSACGGSKERMVNALLEDSLPAAVKNLNRSLPKQDTPSQTAAPAAAAAAASGKARPSKQKCQGRKQRPQQQQQQQGRQKQSVFDGDEFDQAEFIDPSRIWMGKRRQAAKYSADSTHADRDYRKQTQDAIVQLEADEYDDDYDDQVVVGTCSMV